MTDDQIRELAQRIYADRLQHVTATRGEPPTIFEGAEYASHAVAFATHFAATWEATTAQRARVMRAAARHRAAGTMPPHWPGDGE